MKLHVIGQQLGRRSATSSAVADRPSSPTANRQLYVSSASRGIYTRSKFHSSAENTMTLYDERPRQTIRDCDKWWETASMGGVRHQLVAELEWRRQQLAEIFEKNSQWQDAQWQEKNRSTESGLSVNSLQETGKKKIRKWALIIFALIIWHLALIIQVFLLLCLVNGKR